MPLAQAEIEMLGPAEDGCAYPDDLNVRCEDARKAGSSYCQPHHALCHIAPDQRAAVEAEIASLADRFGGRIGHGKKPPKRFLTYDAQPT